MGFFDSVLKAVNKAVDFVGDIQDKANEAYSNKPAEEKADAPKPADAVAYLPESITISMPVDVNARECKVTFFDCDDDNNDAEFDVSVSIDKRFHTFDSGAGEIDASYIYSPDITDDNGYADFKTDTPYILVGFEQVHYNVVRDFRDGKALPSGTTLQTVTGHNRIRYKTTLKRYDEMCVAYHFNRGYSGEDLLYHFEACYPTNYVGTPLEKIILDALDLMALSYKETII